MVIKVTPEGIDKNEKSRKMLYLYHYNIVLLIQTSCICTLEIRLSQVARW